MWTPTSPPKSAENVCRNIVPNFTLKYSLTHNALSSVKFSPDGKYLASAGGKTIKIWKVENGKLEKTLRGHLKKINDVAWYRDSQQLVSASDDKTLIVWDVFRTGCERKETLEGHRCEVICCNFNPHGYLVVSGSVDGSVIIFDVGFNRRGRPCLALKGTVSAVDSNRKGDLFVTTSYDGSCRIWDTDYPMHPLYTPGGETLQKDKINPSLWFAKFSPCGERILVGSANNTLKEYRYKTGTCERTYRGHKSEELRTSGDYFLAGGQAWIVNGSEDFSVYIWNSSTEAVVQILEGHTDAVTSAVSHPNLKMIATAGNDNAIKVWEWISNR